MKLSQNQIKEKTLNDRNYRKLASDMNNMTIEEAREAEVAFNEELQIFREIASMRREVED